MKRRVMEWIWLRKEEDHCLLASVTVQGLIGSRHWLGEEVDDGGLGASLKWGAMGLGVVEAMAEKGWCCVGTSWLCYRDTVQQRRRCLPGSPRFGYCELRCLKAKVHCTRPPPPLEAFATIIIL